MWLGLRKVLPSCIINSAYPFECRLVWDSRSHGALRRSVSMSSGLLVAILLLSSPPPPSPLPPTQYHKVQGGFHPSSTNVNPWSFSSRHFPNLTEVCKAGTLLHEKGVVCGSVLRLSVGQPVTISTVTGPLNSLLSPQVQPCSSGTTGHHARMSRKVEMEEAVPPL